MTEYENYRYSRYGIPAIRTYRSEIEEKDYRRQLDNPVHQVVDQIEVHAIPQVKSREILEEEYFAALMRMRAAKKDLNVWHRGMTAWCALAGLGIVIMGVAYFGANLWPLWILGTADTLLGAGLAYNWVQLYRIKSEKYTTYGRGTNVDTIKYIDPKINLEIRQYEYAKALERLSEAPGDT